MFLLPDGRPVQIIPCCVDTTRCIPNGQAVVSNKTELKKKLGLENCSRLIVHLGALGGLYPEDRIVAVFEEIHRNDPDTGLLVISQAPTDTLIRLYKEAGLPESHLWTGRVGVTEVIGYLCLCDWGLSVKHESHSQLFCSPTKIPEYLLAGLPILASRGIGDTDEILKDHDIGIVFNAWDRSSIRDAVQQMPSLKRDASLPDRCRKIATLVFNLQDIGGKRYQALYEVLLGDDQLRVGK
jgi:glycosyltransferase involved in cell wall biosynthesis